MKWPWQNKNPPELLSPAEGYNRWAATYGEESNPIKDLSNTWIEKLLPDIQGKTILDAGCGTGHFCQLLEKRQPSKIVGLDLSPAMIAQARKNCPSGEFHSLDISIHPIGIDQYELVICALVLGHIEDIRPVIGHLASALKKGGVLLISDFHPFLTLQHAKRTFKDHSGKSFEIQHYLHLFQDVIRSLQSYDIVLEVLEEPMWNNVPVIYAMKFKKQ